MKIAVVGAGASGLASTWLLNEHSEHEVHLFEADTRPGGHANTVEFKDGDKPSVSVDTAFIVFIPHTYPNFTRFVQKHPHLRVLPANTSFTVSRDGGAFEWASRSIRTFFCQPSRVLDPDMWRMLYDIFRFNACARRLAAGDDQDAALSIGQYLAQEGYSDSFTNNYLLPLTGAIWSTPVDKCGLAFPARTLIRFMYNHNLLQLAGRPAWLIFEGGSRTYIDTILSTLPQECLHLETPVRALRSAHGGGVELTTASGRTEHFDHAVLAVHTDTALRILEAGGGATPDERDILGRVTWKKNESVLHSDAKLMPRNKRAWSCWNYTSVSSANARGERELHSEDISVTFRMNELQHIDEAKHGQVFVSINPHIEPDPAKVAGRWTFDHPVIDAAAIRTQAEVPAIQNTRGISYAGAWMGYGFHEDAFTAGLRAAAEHIPGVRPPFPIVTEHPSPQPVPVPVALLFDALERSGVRALLGTVLTILLVGLRALVGQVVDLRHIQGAKVKRA